MLISYVDGQGVVSILVTFAILTPALVDRQGVMSLLLEDCSVPGVCGQGVLAEILVSSVNRHGVVSTSVTVADLSLASVDRQGVVSLPTDDSSISDICGHGVLAEMLVVSILVTVADSVDRQGVVSLPLGDFSIPDVCGQGVLAETLVSSVKRHGVVSILVIVEDLRLASVDRQGIVSLPLEYCSVPDPDVNGHGVLAEMLVSSVTVQGVVSTILTFADLSLASVDRQGIVSLTLGDFSIPDVCGHGVLAEMLVSSVKRHGVLSIVVTVADVSLSSVEQGIVSLVERDCTVPDFCRHGVLAEMLVSSVNIQGVISILVTAADLTVASVDRQGVV